MTNSRYSRSEILTVSALAALLIFSMFSTADAPDSTSANEMSMCSGQGSGRGVAEVAIEYIPQTDKDHSDISVSFEDIDGDNVLATSKLVNETDEYSWTLE